MRSQFAALFALSAIAGCGCPQRPGTGGPQAVPRCEVDLQGEGLFSWSGEGASARVVESEADLIGGQTPAGAAGDVLLQNDRLRAIIQKPGRQIGPILYGGNLVDADLVRSGGPGRDQFGRMGLIHSFGRTVDASAVEILSDGSSGGPAIVAATGRDVIHDLLTLSHQLSLVLGEGVRLAADPDRPLSIRATTYFVLSPGESRVRLLTAFCNDGDSTALMPMVELVDQGGTMDFFNPRGCANGLGTRGCLVDPSPWFGWQGDGVAYAVRAYSLDEPTRPVEANAVLAYGGVAGAFIEARDTQGVLSWTDLEAQRRPGTFSVRPGSSRSYLRDFVVAKDLAEVTSLFSELDRLPRGTVRARVLDAGGQVVDGARVAVVSTADERLFTVAVADSDGAASATLPAGTYRLSAALPGRAIEPPTEVSVSAGSSSSVELRLGATRKLVVTVMDPSGAPQPGKVTVRCKGSCAYTSASYRQHLDLEPLPGGAAAVGLVPPSGSVELKLPPAEYELVVTRGPEFSAWPDSWPQAARPVDLRVSDQAVSAVIARVVDSTGWMSADLHVHAVNSPDSSVPNELRALSFLAEGVEVLLSTDHDFITDYGPVVRSLGAERFMATIVGAEVTSFSHGHFNAFPLIRRDTPNGGAFDWAGGKGPTLRLSQLFAGIKQQHPGAVVQINHPRSGGNGALGLLKVDTATLATHVEPSLLRMEPAPGASADDTGLFGDGFDALEVANGTQPTYSVLNDWMTFLSRGTVRTATGVSDTHSTFASVGGYSRTYAKVGADLPEQLSPIVFADAIRARRAFVTNGPFLRVTAHRLDAQGRPQGEAVEMGGTLSISPASGEAVELEVEVQAPEWFAFDLLELYSHAEGREATLGSANGSWPDSRILQRKVLDVANLPREPVPGLSGFRRLRLSERFTVRPASDNWYVVLLRSTGAVPAVAPLVSSRPFALSNAVLVDADGSGAYDEFPLAVRRGLRVAPPAPVPASPRVLTERELQEAIRKLFHCHGHGDEAE
ncbi:MAG: CehA/McbA family metallohydrolase [Myxococcales bacterium]|nr:CehA/McbA family metallohydrolase [Myxococcales bacterium]